MLGLNRAADGLVLAGFRVPGEGELLHDPAGRDG